MSEPQSASAVMMIRPRRFTSNPLTAPSNAFQEDISAADDKAAIPTDAQKEFDALADALTRAGVRVCVFEDTNEPETPDAVFPNNWISTHADGTVVLYPMLAENRRTERRPDLIRRLSDEHGFRVETIIDFSPFEAQGKALESTGSMILDRVNKLAYACRSPRTDADVVEAFCERFDYRAILFDAVDRDGIQIYHTNVMMTLGTGFAVLCPESIRNESERQTVLQSLATTGHELVAIDYRQMESFAGNMLEVKGNKRIVAMSQAAFDSLNNEQIDIITRHADIVSSPIDTLEKFGGGSVRCMLAEIFLPNRKEDD
ncbi:MAG: amidinotransferase [Gammaproteobacteria bacterium]|nr:amidinotransferase [Gammaproteobacteria bacterium]